MSLTPDETAKQKSLYSKMAPKVRQEPSRLTIMATHLPEIKDWDVDKEYDINLKAKMISKSEGGWDGKEPLQATFQIGTEDPSEVAQDE